MADFNYLVDPGMEEAADFAVDAVRFGDGFVQRAAKGINNGLRRWTVSFSDRSKTEADAIVTFFREKAGATSFSWRPFGFDADVRVVCPSYSKPHENRFLNGEFVYSVRATFQETPI